MTERVGLAVFGVGHIGLIHLKNLLLNERAIVHYVVERDVSKARDIVDKFQMNDTTVLNADDASQVYDDDRVVAVIICSPTFEHESLVQAALQKGRAVFCEKPVSRDLDGIHACYDMAEEVHKPLFCSFNRRFDPSISQLRQRTVVGEIGKLHVVKTCARDHPQPPISYLKHSGGIFHDCAIHDIDMVCWLVGDTPTSVYTAAHAHVDDIRSVGDVDTVVITMKFRSGALATIDLSRYAAYGYDQRLEVFGSKGMLVSGNQRPTELTSYTATGSSCDVIKPSYAERYADSYVGAMQHFLNVVQGKEQMSVTKMDAVNASVVANACQKSYSTGLPVNLGLDEQPNGFNG